MGQNAGKAALSLKANRGHAINVTFNREDTADITRAKKCMVDPNAGTAVKRSCDAESPYAVNQTSLGTCGNATAKTS